MGIRSIVVRAVVGFVCAHSVAPALELTAPEQAFLQTNRTIRVGVDPDFPPFTRLAANGELSGADKEILDLTAARLGLTVKVVPTATWEETLQRARKGEIDVMLSVSASDARRKEFGFTEPYVDFPVAIIVRADAPFSTGLNQLKGRRVATPRNYITSDALRRDYPDITLVEGANISEALEAVRSGSADAAIGNLAVATHYMKADELRHLKIGGITGYRFGLRMAVRKDWPLMVSALDKALADIREPERQAILDRWVHMEFDSRVPLMERLSHLWGWLVGVILVAGLFVLLILRHNRKLAAINDDKSHLMRMTAHDLKNPLTGMLLNLDLLRSDLQPSHESVREVCDRLVPLVKRMDHLVQNLLTVQAIEAGRREFTWETISLNDFARQSVHSVEETASRKLITMDLRLPEQRVMIKGDAQSVHEVMDNLISNALKFSPFSTTIIVRVYQEGAKARFEVWDQGPGVPKDKVPLLFNRFARLGTRTTGGESSSGLGLSIVKSLVEAMHGRVWCESEEGKGAAFLVEFPVAGQK